MTLRRTFRWQVSVSNRRARRLLPLIIALPCLALELVFSLLSLVRPSLGDPSIGIKSGEAGSLFVISILDVLCTSARARDDGCA